MKESKLLYFVRHGETDYNKLRIVQGSGVDSDLNDKGLWQRKLFYEHYKDEGFDYAIVSGLKRTWQTVEPLISHRQIPFERNELINEICWGIHEGKKGTLEMKKAYEWMVEQWRIGNIDAALPGAESARQLMDRVSSFLSYVSSLPYQKVLICTHGRTMRCLMIQMKNESIADMEKYNHHNTGLFLAELQQMTFTMHSENNVDHIPPSSQNHSW